MTTSVEISRSQNNSSSHMATEDTNHISVQPEESDVTGKIY